MSLTEEQVKVLRQLADTAITYATTGAQEWLDANGYVDRCKLSKRDDLGVLAEYLRTEVSAKLDNAITEVREAFAAHMTGTGTALFRSMLVVAGFSAAKRYVADPRFLG
jgi:hypothetical protein